MYIKKATHDRIWAVKKKCFSVFAVSIFIRSPTVFAFMPWLSLKMILTQIMKNMMVCIYAHFNEQLKLKNQFEID